MDGIEPMIEIFKPFGEAFELMKKILFHPFDLGKWCVIGFAAFLAGHFSGSGFGFPSPSSFGRPHPMRPFNPFPNVSRMEPWLMIVIAVGLVLVLLLIVVLWWLKARGSFIFTDCIVHNRAAIAQPWHEYRKEGNSYFLFLLVVGFGSLAFFAIVLLGIFAALDWGNYSPHGADAVPFAIVIVLLVLLWLVAATILGLVSYFMIPVMYIRRCRSLEAFQEVIRLIGRNLGPFVLVALFVAVLIIALIVISTIVNCATCCIASLPYVGTVILLPAFVWLRAFGLLFFRQFGTQYDVWAGVIESQPSAEVSPPTIPPIQPPIQS
jgi:hypothetical protein